MTNEEKLLALDKDAVRIAARNLAVKESTEPLEHLATQRLYLEAARQRATNPIDSHAGYFPNPPVPPLGSPPALGAPNPTPTAPSLSSNC
jgi:hypothetical protein